MAGGLWWVVRSGALALDARQVVSTVEVGWAPAGVRGEERRRERRLDPHLTAQTRRRGWFRPWSLSGGKRICDLVGGGCALLALSPLMLLIAVAIELDSPGPVLFRQRRTGLAGRRFPMLKFRTMVNGAEGQKEALRALNHHGPSSPDFKIRRDPRVTRVGRVLRRTSLDELPNLFNVMKGEMSMVGPRPTPFGIEVYKDEHLARLVVPPGVTGLWQVSGRSEIDFDDRVKLDCRYIREQSPLLDAKILMLTAVRVLDGRGAC